MRIPSAVDKNYFKIYQPSRAALSLVRDAQRKVKPEDPTWDEDQVPKLSELCVYVIAANFEKRLLLSELPCWDRDLLLEILPTDLPLELVVRNIDHDIYWERKVKDRWKDVVNHCEGTIQCWKKLYLERHVQEAIEAMTPEGFDLDTVEKLCELAADYVEVLNLRELQITNPPVTISEEDEFNAFTEPIDHIDLYPIISGFYNLKELHVQFGLRNVGSVYKKSWFQFSLQDCMNLGEGVAKSQNLRLLRLHSSNLDDVRLIALMSRMTRNRSLEELDFSHCLIADEGATAIAKFMKNRKTLKRLNLRNNRIGEDGIANIAYMLAQTNSCPLQKLNVKFNGFGDAGFKYLASGLVRDVAYLNYLNVSCCNLEKESAIFLAETLRRNSILTEVDISNNRLGEDGGRALKSALDSSKTILRIDLRMTGVAPEDMESIYDVLFINRIRSNKDEAGVMREFKLREKRAEAERMRLEPEEAPKPEEKDVPKPATKPEEKDLPKPATKPEEKDLPKPATKPEEKDVPKPATKPEEKDVPKPATKAKENGE